MADVLCHSVVHAEMHAMAGLQVHLIHHLQLMMHRTTIITLKKHTYVHPDMHVMMVVPRSTSSTTCS